MKKALQQKNKGFTLIETMIAVFILVVAMNGLLGLIASSLFSARYSKNDITANYLIQEAVDSIRNDRDTTAFKQAGSGGGWAVFQAKYTTGGCFTANGCIVEPAASTITACDGTVGGNFGVLPCRIFYYDENALHKDFYNYQTLGIPSNFKRQIKMSLNSANTPDELDIAVTVEWLNGSLVMSRTSRVSLLNWQK